MRVRLFTMATHDRLDETNATSRDRHCPPVILILPVMARLLRDRCCKVMGLMALRLSLRQTTTSVLRSRLGAAEPKRYVKIPAIAVFSRRQ